MLLRRVAWLKHLWPMTRRERALAARLDASRAGMAVIAHMLREISTRHDQHAHLVSKVARASRGALTETATLSSVQDLMLAYTADVLARSKQTATDLDDAVEALERLAALQGG